VVFDLGKVLLDFDYNLAATTLAPHSDLSVPEFKRSVDQSPLLHRYESGRMTTAEFLAEVRRTTGFRGSDELFHDRFGAIFAGIPEMVASPAPARRTRRMPTYVFSNTDGAWRSGTSGRRSRFSAVSPAACSSYEARSMKPDPVIYEALETLFRLAGKRSAVSGRPCGKHRPRRRTRLADHPPRRSRAFDPVPWRKPSGGKTWAAVRWRLPRSYLLSFPHQNPFAGPPGLPAVVPMSKPALGRGLGALLRAAAPSQAAPAPAPVAPGCHASAPAPSAAAGPAVRRVPLTQIQPQPAAAAEGLLRRVSGGAGRLDP
jgi:putative hydrolase of the HAD superfamily